MTWIHFSQAGHRALSHNSQKADMTDEKQKDNITHFINTKIHQITFFGSETEFFKKITLSYSK